MEQEEVIFPSSGGTGGGHYDSGSDESDTEEGTTSNNKAGTRDSNALLDTWLAELDSLTTVRIKTILIKLALPSLLERALDRESSLSNIHIFLFICDYIVIGVRELAKVVKSTLESKGNNFDKIKISPYYSTVKV
jgi:hypothetical protein